MTQLYYGLVTAVGTAKLAASAAGGASLALTSMAFGDGGGVETSPTTAATALVNERYRAMLVEKYPHPTNPSILYVEGIIPPGVGGWTLREAGIYDAAGDLIVVAKMPAVNVALISEGASTEGVVRLPIVFDSASSVQILIDPSVVLATQAWVLERVLGRPWVTVDSATTSTPPASPAAHALYLVPVGATGGWAGQANKLAYYLGGWRYYSAPTAKRVSASDTGKAYRRTAGGWEELWVETEVASVIARAGITANPGSGLRLTEAVRGGALSYRTAGGTANALVVALDPVVSSAPPAGLPLRIKISTANTGPVTLNAGWGAAPVTKLGAVPLEWGDLPAGGVAEVVWMGSGWHLAAAPPGGVVVFSAPGTVNWTVPVGVYRAFVQVWGGGGGGSIYAYGSESGEGGGGGGYSAGWVNVVPGQVIPVTIGAGGAGNTTPGGDGGSGGTSSFGSYLSATGGGGGISSTINAPGDGGIGSGGSIAMAGQDGGDGWPAKARAFAPGGDAGGPGGKGAQNATPVRSGTWPGGGGLGYGYAAGGYGLASSGAAGGVIIHY